MRFLVNPGHHGKGRTAPRRAKGLTKRKALQILREGRARGKRLTAKQQRFFGARARGAPIRRARSRSRATASTGGSVTQGGTMARQRKRAHAKRRSVSRKRSSHRRRAARVMHRNPVRRHGKRRRVIRSHRRSRRIRRNPPRFSMGGLKSMLMEGAKDAVGLIIGRAATRAIKRFVPIAQDTAVKQVAVGVGASVAAGYVLSLWNRRYGQLALAIGLADTVSPMLVGLPVVGPYLGGEFLGGDFLGGVGAFPQVGAYPQGGMGAIPMTTGASVMAEDGNY